jgi:hypothetical protein
MVQSMHTSQAAVFEYSAPTLQQEVSMKFARTCVIAESAAAGVWLITLCVVDHCFAVHRAGQAQQEEKTEP